MANLFGILTAIVLALSAFVAFKNKDVYEAKVTETETYAYLVLAGKGLFVKDKDAVSLWTTD